MLFAVLADICVHKSLVSSRGLALVYEKQLPNAVVLEKFVLW